MSLEENAAQRKVQSLIKGKLLMLESEPGWSDIPESLRNFIRKAIVRAAWDGYKTGLISDAHLIME